MATLKPRSPPVSPLRTARVPARLRLWRDRRLHHHFRHRGGGGRRGAVAAHHHRAGACERACRRVLDGGCELFGHQGRGRQHSASAHGRRTPYPRRSRGRTAGACARSFGSRACLASVLEAATEAISADRGKWIDLMLVDEYGLSPTQPRPFRAALATFAAFLAAGLVPLIPFILALENASRPRSA